MFDIQSVVAAIDDSDSLNDVVRAAELLAGARPGCRRHFVHAVPPIPRHFETVLYPWACLGDDHDAILGEMEHHARHRLAGRLRDLAGAGAVEHLRLTHGHGADAVLRLAADLGPDLLVVGSTSHSPRAPGQLGEVATRIARQARGSVLVCRDGHRRASIARMGIALDLGPSSQALLEAALTFAHPHGAEVHPLVVVPQTSPWDPGRLTGGKDEGAANRARKEANRLWSVLTSQLDLPLSIREGALRLLQPLVVASGDPAIEIVSWAARSEVDLVAVGRAQSERASALGRVAEYVARHATANVLLLAPPVAPSP